MNSSQIAERFALGTAQFGLKYGIANSTGQVSLAETAAILQSAEEYGIDTLDTAVAYGDSEQVLGSVGVQRWKVVSKLPELPNDTDDVTGWIDAQVSSSLGRLNVRSLHGLLLHRPMQLLASQGEEIYRSLISQKDRGLVKNIGISIYEPTELDQLVPKFQFDLVQAPFNVLDTRMLVSGWIERLQNLGCELHVRSVFLQGLLLMKMENRPQAFTRWQPIWTEWERWLADSELSPQQACVQFVLDTPGIRKIVVGVESVNQLKQILLPPAGVLPPLPGLLTVRDPKLLNPALWPSR